jgi:hypothetical protein
MGSWFVRLFRLFRPVHVPPITTPLPSWHLRDLGDVNLILDRIKKLQVLDSSPERGAFKRDSSSDNAGLFWTLEALFPFLLIPERLDHLDVIKPALEFVLAQENPTGGFPADPEYKVGSHSAVDSTAYAVLILSLAIDSLSIQRIVSPRAVSEKFVERLRRTLKSSISYLDQQSADLGWGFNRRSPSRVYSTSLVVTAISSCDDSVLGDRPARKLINHGVDYLLDCQVKDAGEKKGAWAYDESKKPDEVNPNITAVAVLALAASYRHIDRNAILKSIDLGVRFIRRAWPQEDDVSAADLCTSSALEEVAYWDPLIEKEAEHPKVFEHPFVMVLGAALLSGELGARDARVERMVDGLRRRFRPPAPRWGQPDLKVFELADIASNLISYYSVTNVLESCQELFSKSRESREARNRLQRIRRRDRRWRWVAAACSVAALASFALSKLGLGPLQIVLLLAAAVPAEIVAAAVIHLFKRLWARFNDRNGNGD